MAGKRTPEGLYVGDLAIMTRDNEELVKDRDNFRNACRMAEELRILAERQRDCAVELLRLLVQSEDGSGSLYEFAGNASVIADAARELLATLDAPRKREALRNLTRITEEAGGYDRETPPNSAAEEDDADDLDGEDE